MLAVETIEKYPLKEACNKHRDTTQYRINIAVK